MHSTECFSNLLFTELVWLTVSQRDSELVEVQWYFIKKNTLIVDPIMLEDKLWMNTWKPVPKMPKLFFLNTAETEFLTFWNEFWGQLGSVRFLENRYPTFLSGSTHP